MPQQPIAIKALSIPELLQRIYPFLSNSDLACCCIVSKAFSDIFTPILWHTISLITQKQHCCFTDSPDIQSALSKNAKYIRVIQVETCRVLAPFLKVDAASLRNIHMLQLQSSVRPTLRKRIKDPYVDRIRDIRKREARNVLPVKVMDWFQERDVFLWRYEIASRILAPDQSKLQHIRETQLSSLYQVVVAMKQRFDVIVRLVGSVLKELGLLPGFHHDPSLKSTIDHPFYIGFLSFWDSIEIQSARLDFALKFSQQFRPATFIRQYMQLLLCVVDARNTRFNMIENFKEEFDKKFFDAVHLIWRFQLEQRPPKEIDAFSKQWDSIFEHSIEQLPSQCLSASKAVGDEIREVYHRVQMRLSASEIVVDNGDWEGAVVENN